MNRTLKVWLIIIGVIGGLAILGNLTSHDDNSSNTPDTQMVNTAPLITEPATTAKPTTTKFEANASAQLSCGHFRNVMSDISTGILNVAEAREKTKQFYDTGQRANVEDIQIATRQMLVAITEGDLDEYVKQAKAMNKACNSVGL